MKYKAKYRYHPIVQKGPNEEAIKRHLVKSIIGEMPLSELEKIVSFETTQDHTEVTWVATWQTPEDDYVIKPLK